MDALDAFFDEVNVDIKTRESEKTAEDFKAEGNAHFAAGAYAEAISSYSKSIEQQPTNHVYLSNRSAARLKLGDGEGALSDADACVSANPLWGKAHGRRGAALFYLKRFDAALEAYEDGLALDKSNATLVEGRDKAKAAVAASSSSSSLDAFLSEVKDLQQANDHNKVHESQKVTTVDHDAQTKTWTHENQLNRVLARNYKFLNLNPFLCFALPTSATEEDIKKRYKKLSALVHPDKNRDPRAHEAFFQVNKAYEVLKKRRVGRTQWPLFHPAHLG